MDLQYLATINMEGIPSLFQQSIKKDFVKGYNFMCNVINTKLEKWNEEFFSKPGMNILVDDENKDVYEKFIIDKTNECIKNHLPKKYSKKYRFYAGEWGTVEAEVLKYKNSRIHVTLEAI